MITKNPQKIQIIKELLDKEHITFEHCLILLEENYEEIFKSEIKHSCSNPYCTSNCIYSNTHNGYTSNSTDDFTIK